MPSADLDARIRTADLEGGIPFAHDAVSLANLRMLNLTCPAGDFDLALLPSGTGGYDDLVCNATTIAITAVEVSVASLDDVIRSKDVVGRSKDIAVLPVLEQHSRRMREGAEDGGATSGEDLRET